MMQFHSRSVVPNLFVAVDRFAFENITAPGERECRKLAPSSTLDGLYISLGC